MAIAGSGGWKPSNIAVLKKGRIEYIAITQNKPPELITPLEEAVERLLAGELVTVDVRWPYMSVLRAEVEQRRSTVAKISEDASGPESADASYPR